MSFGPSKLAFTWALRPAKDYIVIFNTVICKTLELTEDVIIFTMTVLCHMLHKPKALFTLTFRSYGRILLLKYCNYLAIKLFEILYIFLWIVAELSLYLKKNQYSTLVPIFHTVL